GAGHTDSQQNGHRPRGSIVGNGEIIGLCTHPGFSDRLGATRARTLVVTGAHDPMLPSAYLREEIVSKLPAARLVTLDCGHEIPLEQPQELLR
ncbi:MAG TPA: hypothetical protein VJW17_07660, partial [Pyrinomonadaceae bacterium]|nr:hypothetical protein [Pyrinomonadaceae bacterium]